VHDPHALTPGLYNPLQLAPGFPALYFCQRNTVQKPLKQKTMKLKRTNLKQELLFDLHEKINQIEQRLNSPLIITRDWMDPDDICAILHITRKTLSEYTRRGYLPNSHLGGRVYYRLSDVDEYLNNHVVRKEPQL